MKVVREMEGENYLNTINMKTILFTFIFCFVFTFHLFAQQINNGDLENWQNFSNYELPVSFYTYDDIVFLGSPTTTKTTDAYSGQYAALLGTIQGSGTVYQGGLTYGSWYQQQGITYYYVGHPFTGRPAKMKFWYKFYSPGSDSALTYIRLNKWPSTIGEGTLYISANQSTYTEAEVDLTYYSALFPDSIYITFISSMTSPPTLGTQLHVDNITMDYLLTGLEVNSNKYLQLYPNPVTDKIHISSSLPKMGLAELFDLTGKKVKEEFINSNKSEIDISELENGFYFLRFGEKSFKIVKQ
jgi:hypothetical protein